ncbi:MAG: RagB/SusD family nutrient uptake outer membrane protein [Nitritalea sp.]
MKRYINSLGVAALAATTFWACNPLQIDEVIDPNNPAVEVVLEDASREAVQFLITGLEARHRGYVFNVTTSWGTFGREIWYLNGSDPRFQTDWLGQGGRQPDRSYFGFGATGGGSWAAPYQAINQAEVLAGAATNASILNERERASARGFARTIQGFQFMIPANFVFENGIRIDVSDPFNPGPFVSYEEALDHAKSLLDQGFADLESAGVGPFPFRLTRGFDGFNTIAGLQQVNRAIAARLNAYRKDWNGVLTALEGSFMNMSGDMQMGPTHPYGAAPDLFNPLFFVLDAAINTLTVVHPSVLRDTTAGDLRVRQKFFPRTNPVIITTDAAPLTGTHQDQRWPTNETSVPFIRNEELILLKAEAHANLGQAGPAIEAINVIRNAAGIGEYTGANSTAALIDEILYQRRYSLWAEPWGHRWIDTRRYDRMEEIDTSFDGGSVFRQFPHPQAELNWDLYVEGQ